MIYDEELLIKDVRQALESKLNAAIDCVNLEKGAVSGEALFMKHIPTDKYLFEAVDKKVLNWKGDFLLYGFIDNQVNDANQDNYINGTTVTIQVGTFDKGEKQRETILFRLLRYRRAIQKVFQENPEIFRGYARPRVRRLKPDSLALSNNVVILKCGIDLIASTTSN